VATGELDMSAALYLALVIAVAVERVIELRLARRNAARMLARGGLEVGHGHYPWMVALHTLFLLACPLEVFLLSRPFLPALGGPMLALVVMAMVLRYWAVSSLGDRWTTRVVVVPDEPVVRRGPYRWLRHPNYLAVITEIVALPLVHTAWLTALVVSALNAWLLAVRIRAEERALASRADYDQVFAATPRFLGRHRLGR
jgi:methyltransferase